MFAAILKKVSTLHLILLFLCVKAVVAACPADIPTCAVCDSTNSSHCYQCLPGQGVRVTDDPRGCASCQNPNCNNCSLNNQVCTECRPRFRLELQSC